MDLILWRHAEAVEGGEGLDDLDRPLTSRGERQAARMAAWLNQQLPATTRVLVSPARRTQQTALALERKFRTLPSLAPDASVTTVLEAARWPEAKEAVLVIGHQPTLGLVASHLLSGTEQPWAVKKGAVWWLRSRHREREREGNEQVVLVATLTPDQIPH
jgi:phosphohistidine phosphatase